MNFAIAHGPVRRAPRAPDTPATSRRAARLTNRGRA